MNTLLPFYFSTLVKYCEPRDLVRKLPASQWLLNTKNQALDLVHCLCTSFVSFVEQLSFRVFTRPDEFLMMPSFSCIFLHLCGVTG